MVPVFLLSSHVALGNTLQDTHLFSLGVYDQSIDVTGSVTKAPLPEIDVDFDKFLGLEDSSETIFLGYRWRFKEKWSLQAFYSQFDASGKKVASRDFNFDGTEYTAGISLETDFNLDTFLIAANYSFVLDEKKEFGVGLGLHAFDIETEIGAVVGIEDVVMAGERTTADLLAPLPNIRLYGTYMITPKWEVSLSGGWLSFNYNDYDGDYLFAFVLTEYRFTDRFGIGLSYQMSEVDVTHEDNDSKEKFDMEFYGPSIFLTYGF